jgi:hypothetical protein
MNADPQSARDDIAFLRSLVGDDENVQATAFGKAYFAGGLIYGGQMLGHAALGLKLLPDTPAVNLTVGLGPTLVFVPVLIWIIRSGQRSAIRGAVGRAIAAVFASVGLANLFLIAVIGAVALSQHSLVVWLIYPCTVFVLQGMAWLFAYMMRRRGWYALVAAGWFVCGVAMALTVSTATAWFIVFAGLGLWLCMALPGWIMMRNARQGG